MKVRLLYITVSGNTRHFVNNLATYANAQGEFEFEAVEISDATVDHEETDPFFVFVPTYLDGGNGIHSGVKEIMTNALSDQVDYNHGTQKLLGVIGSGNKNFNAQYILTARRYAVNFHAPMIAEYELRGTDRDLERVYNNMAHRLHEYAQSQAPTSASALRLLMLQNEPQGEGILIDDAKQLVSQVLVPSRYDFSHITNIEYAAVPEDIYSAQINLMSLQHSWMWPVTGSVLAFPEASNAHVPSQA
jgi:protein involved in ribonucleotide reduction